MEIWLAAAICLLFVGEGAWRFVTMMKVPDWGPEKATCLFNGVNFLLFALIGGSCLLWPLVSGWLKKEEESEKNGRDTDGAGAENKAADPTAAADDDDVVVVVDSGDMKALEVESKPKQSDLVKSEVAGLTEKSTAKSSEPVTAAPAATNPPAKRHQLVYLTNMKTFLTFIVVTHHTVNNFSIAACSGMGTYSYDPLDPYGVLYTFMTGAMWFSNVNQNYFMGAFFLISAYFCPKSLDRKGFRAFVIDKMVRLGGPFILYSVLLGPLLTMWCSAFADLPLHYTYSTGPPWFILWLLNFSIIYAVVAQVLPSLHFKMPHPLLLLVLGLGLGGVFYAISINLGDWGGLGNMAFWQFGFAIYVPFFIAGIAGGRNDWLRENVENMATWVVCCLWLVVVGMWLIQFFSLAQIYPPTLTSVHISGLEQISIPIYAIAMTLAEMQLFYQYFNSTFGKKWIINAGAAAYAVYVIHTWVLSLFQVIFVAILKAANVPILFSAPRDDLVVYYTVGANGEPALLPDAYLWGGWLFVFVLTQLVVWPLAHYFRKLPVMNKMF